MPTISSKFKVDGEREYKHALSQIADSTKVLNSEMRLVKAQFSENANSMDALTAKGEVYEKQIANQRDRVATLEKALKEAAERYGETDKRTKQWQTSLNNAKAELVKLEDQMDDNNAQIKEFGESTEESSERMGGLGDMISQFADKVGIQLPEGLTSAASSLGSINMSFLAVAGGIGAAVAAIVKVETALINMTKASAAAADEILTNSVITGISTDTLQEYAYAAQFVDVSVETITDSQAKLIRSMSDAQSGTASQVEAFEKLGVEVTNADGTLRDAQDVFWDVIESLGSMTNETERDALAMEILGRSAQELNPLIEAGADRMKELAEEAHEVGYVMSTDTLDALGGVDDAMNRFNNRIEAVKNNIAAQLAPYLETATERLSEFVTGLGDDFEESGIVDSFGSILESASGLLQPLGQIVEAILPAVTVAIELVADAVQLIADALTLCIEKLAEFSRKFTEFAAQYANSPLFQPVFGTSTQYGSGSLVTDAFDRTNQQTQNSFVSGSNSALDSWMNNVNQSSNVTVFVEAKNVKEFNDVINTAKNAQIQARMYGMG